MRTVMSMQAMAESRPARMRGRLSWPARSMQFQETVW